MVNGFMIYRSAWDDTLQRFQVRACPDPAAARAVLEELLDAPVRWEAAR